MCISVIIERTGKVLVDLSLIYSVSDVSSTATRNGAVTGFLDLLSEHSIREVP